MNPTGKPQPVMGVQVQSMLQGAHTTNGVNNIINNNVPPNFAIRSPVVITTPPSPQVPVKPPPSISPLVSSSSSTPQSTVAPKPTTTVTQTPQKSTPTATSNSSANSTASTSSSGIGKVIPGENTNKNSQVPISGASVFAFCSPPVPTSGNSSNKSNTNGTVTFSDAPSHGNKVQPNNPPNHSVGNTARNETVTPTTVTTASSSPAALPKTPESGSKFGESGQKTTSGSALGASAPTIPITTSTSVQSNLQKASPHNQINCPTTVTGTDGGGFGGAKITNTKITSSSTSAVPSVTAPQTSSKINKMDSHEGKSGTNLNNNEIGDVEMKGPSKTNKNAPLIPAKNSVSTESNGSYSLTDSDSEVHPPQSSRPSTTGAGGGKLLDGFDGDEIGDDVRLIVTLLENAGFCAPSQPSTGRPGTAGSDIVPPARPSTAEKTFKDAFVAGMRDIEGKLSLSAEDKMKQNKQPKVDNEKSHTEEKVKTPNSKVAMNDSKVGTPSATASRPPTGTGSRSRPGTAHHGGVASPQTPVNKDKTPKSESGKVLGESRSRIGRTSTPRAASASASATTTPPISTLREKSPRNKDIGGTPDSSTRPKSALPSTARSRPSSTLYQHTASSAQKGILGNSPANLNLSDSSKPSPNLTSTTPKSSRPSTRPRTSASKMGDSTAGSGDAKPATLKDQFTVFCKFGDTASDGKHITLSNSDKWMKQAKVIDGKKITTTDTSICFKKLFKTTKKVPLEDFKKYVEELAKSKSIEPTTILDKLTNCGTPGLSTATKAAHAGVVDRLTDTSKYTGSHKERFDATGKGKGLEGRRDVVDGSGYVASFKDKLDLNKDSPVKGGSPSPTPAPAKESSPAPTK